MRIIEFVRMPRAGKTTQMRLLEEYLKEKGLKVGVINDRGRGHSVATPPGESLAYVIALASIALDEYFLHRDVDVLLVDRGFSDIAVWAEVYYSRGTITKREQAALVALFERFTQQVSLVLNFQVDPDTAVKRHLDSKESHASDTVGVEKSFLVDLEQAYSKVFPLNCGNVRSISGYPEASITHGLVRRLVDTL